MWTYFLYNSILIVALSSAYIAEHEKHIDIRCFARIMVFLTLFIPAALRYNTGTDFMSYVSIFNRLNPNDIYLEKSWFYFNRFIKNLGLGSQWVFVFSAVLIYFPICFFTDREHFSYLILFYILMGYYLKSYNALRQCISVSFIIASICFFRKNRLIFAIINLFLAFAFHKSAVLFVPFVLLFSIKYKSCLIPFVIAAVGIAILMTMNVFELVFNFLGLIGSKYAGYGSSVLYTSKKLGTGLGVIVRCIPCFFAMAFTKKLVTDDKRNSFVITASIVFLFANILASQMYIFGRLQTLFAFVPMMYWGKVFSVKTRYSKILRIIYCLLLIFIFEKDAGLTEKNTVTNYPYISVFEKYQEF